MAESAIVDEFEVSEVTPAPGPFNINRKGSSPMGRKQAHKRRQSNSNVDAIHDLVPASEISPAQMYLTESGHLYHAGKLVIVLVGVPERGKTSHAVSITRYLRWLGVKAHAFHRDDYIKEGKEEECLQDLVIFLKRGGGQVAIYDSENYKREERKRLRMKLLTEHNIDRVLFVECTADGDETHEEYEQMGTEREADLSFIKLINNERFLLNHAPSGYLQNRIAFFLLNNSLHSGTVYFARAGLSNQDCDIHYKSDDPLSAEGHKYAFLLQSEVEKRLAAQGKKISDLVVWTSKRLRTVETAEYFQKAGHTVTQRTQLTQLNPGDTDGLTALEIKAKFPEEYAKHVDNPYHHRYSRSESYHDLAVRMEPLIMEIERSKEDLLIIAHESVLRVLYGYLMACSVMDIPDLQFPKEEIVEIIPKAYFNVANRIVIGRDI